ncbi:flavin-linked sulfhydryl oxidase [Aspergillus homomorphus CBS 101889]|uniref:Sulfhydryl oxidase n=1 Tax=Aspergillus homomorphus (strain CBS 101889) TaxID=1450537 RepID=A0A395HTQ3_ASPHC|nr:hypothetical protein BO97DRAFT_444289 [Aspergillus homomorphus CBS 101889]RAL10793.1 hypothetical protein BO97DRAFT_444289 [Aspergillus homomorphus CBS 101889]
MTDSHPDATDTAQKKLFAHQFQTPAAPATASSSTQSPKVPVNEKSTTGEHIPPGYTKLPNGVILDREGKPCRLCTSAASWRAITQKAKAQSQTQAPNTTMKQAPTNTPAQKPECPPDVEELGRSTWTLLHSLTAAYPAQATAAQQTEMRTFLGLFSRLYPCWVCAGDFRAWMGTPQNEPRLATRQEFGDWMCQAHNEVNRKLGKKEFDCRLWEERWRTGWKDGRCD